MRKIYQFISLIAIICMVIPANSQNNDWQTFENEKCSVKYPSTWTMQELTEEFTSLGIEFSIVSAKENDKDEFFENVNFLSEPLTDPNSTLDTYANDVETLLKSFIKGYKKISSKKVNSQNGDFFMIEYTGKLGTAGLYWLQYTTVKNGKNYILSFTAEKKNYKLYKPTFETIWQSFLIKE